MPIASSKVAAPTILVVKDDLTPGNLMTPALDKPGFDSAAGRWARYVASACASEEDFKTLGNWARFIGVSCSSLCESCRMLGIRPRDARDFTRMLRALIHAAAHRCSPLVLLNVSDRRTLRKLLERSGLRSSPMTSVSVDRFIHDQRLIPGDREEVRLVRLLLCSSRTSSER